MLQHTEIDQGIAQVLAGFRKPGQEDAPLTIDALITDSLDMMKFLVALEDHFGVYIDESFLGTASLRDLAFVRDAVAAALAG
jgi:acyl carrier protein